MSLRVIGLKLKHSRKRLNSCLRWRTYSGNREVSGTGFEGGGGDHNTQYFHSWATHKRKVNFITSIQDETSSVWTKPEDISRAFQNYYQALFSTTTPSRIEDSLGGVLPSVTNEMNLLLNRVFTNEEIDVALQQMHPLKSPGLDGFSDYFYQSHWASVGHEVRKAVLFFF
jgi:hypothetical protein